jgi:hypothetical protein
MTLHVVTIHAKTSRSAASVLPASQANNSALMRVDEVALTFAL